MRGFSRPSSLLSNVGVNLPSKLDGVNEELELDKRESVDLERLETNSSVGVSLAIENEEIESLPVSKPLEIGIKLFVKLLISEDMVLL